MAACVPGGCVAHAGGRILQARAQPGVFGGAQEVWCAVGCCCGVGGRPSAYVVAAHVVHGGARGVGSVACACPRRSISVQPSVPHFAVYAPCGWQVPGRLVLMGGVVWCQAPRPRGPQAPCFPSPFESLAGSFFRPAQPQDIISELMPALDAFFATFHSPLTYGTRVLV